MDNPQNSVIGVSQANDTVHAYIASRIRAGASKKAIIQELIQRGYDPTTANELVSPITRKHSGSVRKAGLLKLVIGILIFVIFLGMTIDSIITATEQGGTYFIFYGLILGGLYLIIRGSTQLFRGR